MENAAKAMLADGMNIDLIAKYIQLPIERIQAMAEEFRP